MFVAVDAVAQMMLSRTEKRTTCLSPGRARAREREWETGAIVDVTRTWPSRCMKTEPGSGSGL